MKASHGLFALAVAGATLLAPAAPASAHPLGNFTVNVYSGLRLAPNGIDVELVVDMAEIPAFQARRDVDAAGRRYAPTACADALAHVELRVNDRVAPLRLGASNVTFPPGAGGLPTLRLSCSLRVDVSEDSASHDVRFRNRLYDDRVGWHEITAVGDGATLVSSDVAAESVSAALTAYPDDLLSSPLRQTEASVRAVAGGPSAPAPFSAPGLPGGADRASQRFTDLVTRDLTVGAGVLAFLAAVVLGSAHSLAPGHGKTLMAAYLVGQRGSLRQAVLIALTVTLTHTAGVLVLVIVVSAFTGFAPDGLYAWFAIFSGVTVGVIGAGLLRKAWARRSSPVLGEQQHAHDHGLALDGAFGGHAHHGHLSGDHLGGHTQADGHNHAMPELGARPSRRNLLAMGLAGGMVPTPSAVLVLLAAVGLGRAWFGVVLVLAYGLGMAVTLTGAGLVLVRARSAIERRLGPNGRLSATAQFLPMATAAAIVVTGVFLTARGANQL